MDNNFSKEVIVTRILSRAETALYFLEEFLVDHNAKDVAYLRSILIDLSYSFELILKAAYVVLVTQARDSVELEKELISLGHDIVKISEKLGNSALNRLGISQISLREGGNFVGYIVKYEDKEFSIEDFVDVRYDFMKDALRELAENDQVKEAVTKMLKIIKGLKDIM